MGAGSVFFLAAINAAQVDAGDVFSFIGPVIGAAIAAFYGYRAAVRVADRNLKAQEQNRLITNSAEGRRVSLDEWNSLTSGLREEIARIKAERAKQDDKIERVLDRVGELEIVRDALETRVRNLVVWAIEVSHVLERSDIIEVLQRNNIRVPPPPFDDRKSK